MSTERIPIHRLPVGVMCKTPKWWCKRDIQKQGVIEDVFTGTFGVFIPRATLHGGNAFAMAVTETDDSNERKIMSREIPATNEAFDVYNENIRRLFGYRHPHFFFIGLGRDGLRIDTMGINFHGGEKCAQIGIRNQPDIEKYLRRHIGHVALAQTVADDEVADALQFEHYQLVFNHCVFLPKRYAELLLYADNADLISQWNQGFANKIYTVKPHLSGWYTRLINGEDKRHTPYSMILGLTEFSEESGVHDWPRHFHRLHYLFDYASKGDQSSFNSCLIDMVNTFETALEEAKR